LSRLACLCLPLLAFLAGCGAGAQGAGLAASVNGHGITLAQYNQQVYVRRMESLDGTGVDVCAVKSTASLCSILKRGVLNQLISDEVIRQYAAAHHIAVSNQQFETAWIPTYQQQFHGSPAVLNAYAKRMHLTPADVKAQTRQSVLQQQVMYAVTSTLSPYTKAVEIARIDVATPQQMASVQNELQHGKTFQQVAAQLNSQKTSICHTQGGCGQPEWLPDSFVPAGDTAVFTAKPGTVTGPFFSQQIQELDLVVARDNHYAMTQAQELRARQQVFAGWLSRQEKKATIVRYVHP